MSMDDGESSQVEGESYCLKKSFNVRNVEEMNMKMKYNDLSDLANTPRPATAMKAQKSNPQMGPKSADASKNDRKGSAY